MKNIINIITHDFRKLGSSIVALITIMGLCIVPCLYAWFNIFSNWAPYESEATSRIAVAVANEDKGSELLGLTINVGEKITEALKANKDIGWVILDSKDEAVEGVYAGDYYAALVVPEDFSDDVMSFISGDLKNPELIYYENEKKNAIAPKITGKAKTAVQEEVNKTFVETLAKYITEAASVADASGMDPQQVLSDLSNKMDTMSGSLDNALALVNASVSLAEAAQDLLDVSDGLIGDAQNTVKAGKKLLKTSSGTIPDSSSSSSVTDSVKTELSQLRTDLKAVRTNLRNAISDMDTYNKFLEKDLATQQELAEAMKKSTDKMSDALARLGLTALSERFADLSEKLENAEGKLDALETADENTWPEIKETVQALLEDLKATDESAVEINTDVLDGIDGQIDKAIANIRSSVSNMRKSLNDSYGNLSELSNVLESYEKALYELEGGLDGTTATIMSMQRGFKALSAMFSRIAGSDALDDINYLLTDGTEAVAGYLASPIKMNTEVIYPIDEYGSAMAPFYTVLAQWVGALLTAVLVKTNVKKRKDLEDLRLHQWFFGRYGLYLLIGLAQALIVSLGDLLYVDIQCLHPVRFVLAACVNGITFMMINYALVFGLDNIGLGAGVIVLVLQVAGSGGTYPVEVLPEIFRKLYPAMPFRYAMDAMRECIGGMYDGTYAKCIGILFLFTLGSILFALAVYKPALRLNKMISESKSKSDIML